MAPSVSYTFYGGTKLAVFSWQGCTIKVTGALKVEYIASETPMSVYMNLHVALENRRQSAWVEGDAGPRVGPFPF